MREVNEKNFADLPVGTQLYDEQGRYMGTIAEKIDSTSAALAAPTLGIILSGALAKLPGEEER